MLMRAKGVVALTTLAVLAIVTTVDVGTEGRALAQEIPNVPKAPAGLLSSPQAVAAIVAGVVSILTGIVTAVVTYYVTIVKFRLDNRTMFQAELAARKLMMHPTWQWRTFEVIRHHLGGFKDNELRQILVRAGAIRTKAKNGKEVWGLLDRNRAYLGVTRLQVSPNESNADLIKGVPDEDDRKSPSDLGVM
jgi:hypothetical protein